MAGPNRPVRTAARKAATNWGAVVVFVVSALTMLGMAHNLQDGSELRTTIVTAFISFAALFVGHWFRDHNK